MILTKEEAVKFHRQMWRDMQKVLGDNPKRVDREEFKAVWCTEHFPDEEIVNDCFLCEYDCLFGATCDYCPIEWGSNLDMAKCCSMLNVHYGYSPISKILALPEREYK